MMASSYSVQNNHLVAIEIKYTCAHLLCLMLSEEDAGLTSTIPVGVSNKVPAAAKDLLNYSRTSQN